MYGKFDIFTAFISGVIIGILNVMVLFCIFMSLTSVDETRLYKYGYEKCEERHELQELND